MKRTAEMHTNGTQKSSPKVERGLLMKGEFLKLLLIITVCATANEAISMDSDPLLLPEYQVKAAFLYNFIKFVEWPNEALQDTSNTITIGILGKSPISAALKSIEDKGVKKHKLVIKHFKKHKDLELCHVLFISQSARKSLNEVLEKLQGSSTLTISEVEEFPRFGGMINFIIVESKVRFEINIEAAEKANLKISSKLLRLARIFREKK